MTPNYEPWPAPALLELPTTVARGTVVATRGTSVSCLYLVQRGVIGLFPASQTEEHLLGIRTAGWLLGAVPVLAGGRHEVTSLALTELVVSSLSVRRFRSIIDQIETAHWLNAMLSHEIQFQLARSVALTRHGVRVLLEELFLELLMAAGRPMADGGIRLSLELSVKELSGLVGASREHTSRLLGELEADGTLVRIGGWFTAPSRSPLLAKMHEFQRAM